MFGKAEGGEGGLRGYPMATAFLTAGPRLLGMIESSHDELWSWADPGLKPSFAVTSRAYTGRLSPLNCGPVVCKMGIIILTAPCCGEKSMKHVHEEFHTALHLGKHPRRAALLCSRLRVWVIVPVHSSAGKHDNVIECL